MKKYFRSTAGTLAATLILFGSAMAQTHSHVEGTGHSGGMNQAAATQAGDLRPTEPGQSAFAAIAEIATILRADPATDWGTVDIEALRRHLIDMDNVTLRAVVGGRPVEGGMRYNVTSADLAVEGSIRRMLLAHAATMSGVDGMQMQAEEIDGGACLTVTGPDTALMHGLGFIGLMTAGMHHLAHHLALAAEATPALRSTSQGPEAGCAICVSLPVQVWKCD
jgi:hypothetical protein